MIRLCAWCLASVKAAGCEVTNLADEEFTHGICVAHNAEMLATMESPEFKEGVDRGMANAKARIATMEEEENSRLGAINARWNH